MRTWARAVVHMFCGACGSLIAPGEPMLVLQMANVKRKAFRCQKAWCAGEQVPIALPAQIERCSTTKRMRQLSTVAFDWKQRQAEREPT